MTETELNTFRFVDLFVRSRLVRHRCDRYTYLLIKRNKKDAKHRILLLVQ